MEPKNIGDRYDFSNRPDSVWKMLYVLDKSCPGSGSPCNGNGQCDFLTGTCICNIGNTGLDCSGQWNESLLKNNLSFHTSWNFYFLEWICPGNCSDAGLCDTATGKCSCDTGRHGSDCSSNLSPNTAKITL